ncbi:MAG: tetratricopeptide repeat protein [Proteobacteria bacterium]|nr:tetratricopeptide repeat protein [Pseudomonadota bacterium]
MPEKVEIRLFGDTGLLSGNSHLLRTRKSALVVAYLAFHLDQKVPRERLRRLLWSDRADEQAAGSLRRALVDIRKAFLEEDAATAFEVDTQSLCLKESVVSSDVVIFEQLLAAGDEASLAQAADIYKGDLLSGIDIPDDAFEEWAGNERRRLNASASHLVEQLSLLATSETSFQNAISLATRLLASDRTNEEAHRSLIRIYLKQGRSTAAAKQFSSCEAALKEELGVAPEEQTVLLIRSAPEEAGSLTASDTVSRHQKYPREASPAQTTLSKTHRNSWIVAVALCACLGIIGALFFWPDQSAQSEEPASLERMAFPLPEKPSIAVLPLVNLSNDPGQERYVDGLTNDIITDLSRFGDLAVIAAYSTFGYKGQTVGIQTVAEQLGVHYVLKGSVQKEGNKFRLNAQLIDALSGKHLWAERYSVESDDIFGLQDELTKKVAFAIAGLGGSVVHDRLSLAKQKRKVDLTAYDYFLLASEARFNLTPENITNAGELCEKAAELDPQFSRAYMCIAFAKYLGWLYGWIEDPDTALKTGFAAAKQAVALDRSEAEAHWILADYYQITGQIEEAIDSYKTALALNPNHADVMAEWGWNMIFLTGDAPEGVKTVKQAMRLNPYHAEWYRHGLGNAQYAAGQYEDAIATLKTIETHVLDSRVAFAGSYAQLGQMKEAEEQKAFILGLQPDFSIAEWLVRHGVTEDANVAKHFREGLEKAGLSDGPAG